MEQEYKDLDKIERYVNGSMEGAELATFETELKTNEELLQEVELFQDLMVGIDIHEDRILETTVQQVHNKLEKESFFKTDTSGQKQAVVKTVTMDTSRRSRRFVLGIAASLALLLTAGWFLLRPSNNATLDPKSGFANFYKPETKNLTTILDELESLGMAASDDAKADSLATALQFYEKGEYEASRQSLLTYTTAYPDDQVAQLYLGLTYIQRNNYSKGVELLKPLIENTSFEYRDAAMWYASLGSSQLEGKSGYDYSNQLLKELCNRNTDYREVACDFLKYF